MWVTVILEYIYDDITGKVDSMLLVLIDQDGHIYAVEGSWPEDLGQSVNQFSLIEVLSPFEFQPLYQ